MNKTGVLLAISALSLMACQSPAAPQETAAPEAPFAAFYLSSMVVDLLETPVAPPYAAGSTRSGSLLTSSDPNVVTVDAGGNLVGHQNGQATVRTSGGSALRVVVQAASAVRVEPAQLDLRLGEKKQIQVLADGALVPGEAVRWTTTDPNVATAEGLTIAAGKTEGVVLVNASVGGATATVEVAVTALPVPLKIEPSRATVAVGSTQQLRLSGSLGTELWQSSNPAVLSPLRDGLFLARAVGGAQACAVRGRERVCANVNVVR
jgi:uncharacterized protein YjdB